MAITFVQVNRTHGINILAQNVTVSVTATAGNTLIAALALYYSGTTQGISLTGATGGGTWSADGGTDQHFASGDNFVAGFASCLSTTGGTFNLVLSWSGTHTGNEAATVWVYEFSGFSGTTPLRDAAGTGTQGSSSPVATTSLTNPTANDVMFAMGMTASASTETHGSPSNSWTMPSGANETDAAWVTGMTAYKIVSASASQSTSWTDSPSTSWSSYIIAYKQVGGGATTAYRDATSRISISSGQDTPELYGRPDGLSGQRTMIQILAL